MSLLVLTPPSQQQELVIMKEETSSSAAAGSAIGTTTSKRRKSLGAPPSSRTRSKHRRCGVGGSDAGAGGPPTAAAAAAAAVAAVAGTPIVPLAEEEEDEVDSDSMEITTKQKQQHETTTLITTDDIIYCINTLFPDNDLAAVSQPCVSSRIFACFAFHLEKCPIKDDNSNNSSFPTQTVSTVTTSAVAASLEPLLPFFRSLVLSELVSLRTNNGCEDTPRSSSNCNSSQSDVDSTTTTPSSSALRKIQFSGFDCSSTQPPIDRVDGSAGQHQDSIDALRHVVDTVQSLVSSDSHDNPSSLQSSQNQMALESLIDFLDNYMTSDIINNKENHQKAEKALKLQKLCAMSIAPTYPHQRIAKAVAMYANEAKIVLARIIVQRGGATAVAAPGESSQQQQQSPVIEPKLLVERRMAEFVGQAIRFQLRHLLNPAPPRLTPKDTEYDVWSKNYSQVHSLITLVDSSSGDYVSGERITSLFNLSLDYLCEHFGLEKLLDITFQQPVVPPMFCAKPATKRGVAVRGNLPALTDDEIADVIDDIQQTTSFLAATRACRFLHRFLSLPRVRIEIERQGGWGEVETYASISWLYNLWKTCPEDEHLVMLCNYDAFFSKINVFLRCMSGSVERAAVDSLTAVANRFHIKTKSSNLKVRYPEIVIIAAHLEEAWQVINALPVVDEATS